MTNREILTRIETKIDSMSRDLMKVVYALIGVVGANVGVKFINSPIYLVISGWLAAFAGLFVISSVIHKWKSLPKLKKIMRLTFSFFVIFSVYCREAIVPRPPDWYGLVINLLFIIISILLVMSVWNDKAKSSI